MMRLLGLGLLIGLLSGLPALAGPVVAKIDLSQQTMRVSVDGTQRYVWRVSTGKPGYRTPTGTFRPYRLARTYYSKKYDNAPMPNSVFFLGGYAIHGTYKTGSLGSAVSHGCVRLAPGNAATLYSLVQKHGLGNARVIVTN
jgi:lipoprotein-anchoring transpeptidase ErfK/SrfK